ncbi:MAG TPA: 5'-3' exonuclease [Kineosporiaceae bacterium]|nr:5'-3' exonuclease [Kineosporiaceae bacterium]
MPTPDGPRLLLLDSASLYFRAFFGVPSTITAPDGTPVNAVRGFLDMISTLLGRGLPDLLVACWDDDWRPDFRVRAIPSYKAHRLADPVTGAELVAPELAAQVPVIAEVLAALGLARIGVPGYEADDVIATLACAHEGPVDVVTGDRDLFQLVDDTAGIRVLYVGRGVRNLEVIDQTRLRERYAVADGPGYADLAVLRGDPSDGLPGVPGVGEKTAAGLLARFHGLPQLIAAAGDPGSDLPPGIRAKLAAAQEYLQVAPEVVRVVRDLPVPAADLSLPRTPADPQALLELSRRWGLDSPLARLVDALGG